MHGAPAAAALTRALVLLARARASGELEASGREGRARIVLRGGSVVAIDAPAALAPLLGRLLVEQGVPQFAVEEAARAAPARVGEAVVRAGLAGQGAVSHALRTQLRARARAIARWTSIDLRFEPGSGTAVPHAEPVGVGDLMLGAMREALRHEPAGEVRARLADTPFVLTPLGEALLDGTPLWPDEQVACALLRRGTHLDELEAACRGAERALRCVLALRWLGGAGPPTARASVAHLVRKARQLRRSASACEILELAGEVRPDEARRAWRRLAGALHPDRFAGAPAPLLRVSEEVLGAINGAARSLGAVR